MNSVASSITQSSSSGGPENERSPGHSTLDCGCAVDRPNPADRHPRPAAMSHAPAAPAKSSKSAAAKQRKQKRYNQPWSSPDAYYAVWAANLSSRQVSSHQVPFGQTSITSSNCLST